jgi:NADP-dependent 3-hydroxy acid dehydrogenase YdfG
MLAPSASSDEDLKRSILFTNATAATRGNPGFSAFAGACHAKRALAQSMARELGVSGIHVANIVIDGAIETEFIKGIYGAEKFEEMKKTTKVLRPSDIASSLYFLSQQEKSAWTFEIDLRPFGEKF